MSETAARERSAASGTVDGASVIGLAILCAMAFLWDVALVRLMVTLNMNDFGKFYYSARAFLAGQDMYAPSPATQLGAGLLPGAQQLLNLNPPHFHLLVIPLAGFRPGVAVTVWMFANTFALVISLLLAAGELGISATPKRVLLIVLFVLTFSASQAEFITGQLTFLLLLPMMLCWRDARRGAWSRAGAWLGLCLSIKLFVLIFLPYLIGRRRWQAAFLMIATSAACLALGAVIFGIESYRSWLGALQQSADWAWLGMNASILGTLQRVFTTSPSFEPIMTAPGIARVWIAIAAIVGVVTLFVVVVDKSSAAIDRAFALLLIAAQLISPVGWVYYMWLAVVPVIAVGLGEERIGLPRSAAARSLLVIPIAGLFSPITAPYYFEPSVWATVTLGSVYFWGTLTLWGYLIINGIAHARQNLREPSLFSTKSTAPRPKFAIRD